MSSPEGGHHQHGSVELHDDAEKRSRFATAARKRVQSAFDVEDAVRKLEAVWNEITG